MTRTMRILMPVGVFFLVTVGLALAAIHFLSATGSFVTPPSLTVKFKEAGLGNNQNILYELTADAKAVYACVNGGGKIPSDAKKTAVEGPVSKTDTFNSGKNGSISASLKLDPPPPTGISCPGGQTTTLFLVSYTNVRLADKTNNVSTGVGSLGGFQWTK